jgi:hypothetical protein
VTNILIGNEDMFGIKLSFKERFAETVSAAIVNIDRAIGVVKKDGIVGCTSTVNMIRSSHHQRY